MAQVDTFSSLPAFPRPTSLYQPERITSALIDSSSYSPFPSISGARRDPFGLDAFLLHPEDQMWAYLAPMAAPDKDRDDSDKSQRPAVLQKRGSMMGLRKPSPLSQPPAGPVLTLSPPSLSRRRSKSFDSASTHSSATTAVSDQPPQKSGTVGRKGIRGLFGRRKSISSLSPDTSPLSSVHSTPSGSNVDLSMTNRTPSTDDSGCSTATSSDGVQTPTDSPRLNPTPVASQEGKKKGFRSIFARKPSSVSLASQALEAAANATATAPAQEATPALPVDPISRITFTAEQRATAFTGDQVRRTTYRKLAQLRRPSPHPLAQHLRRQYSHLPQEVISSLEAGQAVYPRSVNWYSPESGLSPAQGGLWTTLAVKIVLDKLDAGHQPSGSIAKRTPAVVADRGSRSMANFVHRLPFEERHHVYFPGAWSLVSMARPGFGVWDLDFSPYILALADVGRDESFTTTPWPALPRPSFGEAREMESAEAEPAAVAATQPLELDVSAIVESPVEASPSPASSLAPLYSPDEKASTDGSDEDVKADMLVTPPVEATAPIPEIKIDFEGGSIGEALSGSSFRRSRSTHWAAESDSDDEDDHVPLAVAKSRVVKKTSMPLLSERVAPVAPSRLPVAMTSATTPDRSEKQKQRAMDEVARARERRHALNTGEVDRMAEGELRRNEEAKRRSVIDPSAAVAKRTSVLSPSSSLAQLQLRPQSTGGTAKRMSTVATIDTDEVRRRTKSGGLPLSQSQTKLGDAKRYHSFYEVQSHAASTAKVEPVAPPRPARGGSFPAPQNMQPRPTSMAAAYAHPAPVMPVPLVPAHMFAHSQGQQVMYYPQPQGMSMSMSMPMLSMGMQVPMQMPMQMPHMGMYAPSTSTQHAQAQYHAHRAGMGMANSASRSSLVVPHSGGGGGGHRRGMTQGAQSSGSSVSRKTASTSAGLIMGAGSGSGSGPGLGQQGDRRSSSFASLPDARRSRRVA